MSVLLEASRLSRSFGGLRALADLDLAIEAGEIHALIGPNGAGKTTFLNVLSGIYRPTSGQLRFEGRDIRREPPHSLAKLGVSRTFQNIRLFADMPAIDNVMVAGNCLAEAGLLRTLLGFSREEEAGVRERAERLLLSLGLERRANNLAGDLPYGQQRMLEIARALMSQPRLLLLDEPAAGLIPSETLELLARIKTIRDGGVTVLLIEHNMKLVMGVCERITVLDFGRKIAEGTPTEIQTNQAVIEAYLGKGEDDALV